MYTKVTDRLRLIVLLGATWLVLTAANVAQAQNLITNGSFESTAPGVVADLEEGVDGWVIELGQTVASAPVFEIVEDPAQDGSRALKVVIDGTGDNAWDIQLIGDSIHVEPGGTYRFTAWARTESGEGTAAFTVGNYAFNEYGALRTGVVVNDQWQEYTLDFTVSDAETVIRAPIHFSMAANVGQTIYIDNVSVVDPSGGETTQPLAHGLGKFLGNVYSNSQVPGFEQYWNQVTPENAGKWGSVEGTRDQMNWGTLDASYQFAKTHGFPFRFHVLVWGNQQPGWIAALPQDEQLAEIEEWFRAVAERYPEMEYVEVVNEPLHDPPDGPGDGGYMEALGGTGATGWDWVLTAFRMARDIFPSTTKLMINDYGILGSTQNARRYAEIVELLKAEDLIDVIGVQGHAFSTRPGAPLTPVLDILAETELPIMVTEMDVDGNPNMEPRVSRAASDQTQLEAMQRIFPALWSHPSVIGITLWGWRPGLWRQEQEAYLVRENGAERPALEFIRTYLQSWALPAQGGADVPETTALIGNYPNPFNPSTRIRYRVAAPAEVTLKVFDLLGRQVRTLVSGYQSAGEYTATFDATDLSSGIYLYRLEAGSVVQTRRMVLVK